MIAQQVTVDHGDLLEACQAANAWAGYLRFERVLPESADRIDQAVARLREAAAERKS